MKIVIIGGGNAGIATATRLRRANETAEIIILEKSTEFAVAKCGLNYLISEIVDEPNELIAATPQQMQRTFNVKVKLNHEVIGINRDNKIIKIENHPDESYDKLIIATGAIQLRPDIKGILGENIFTIKNLESITRINEYLTNFDTPTILIMGGGKVGLELAEAFYIRGAEIIINESSSHILPEFDADCTKEIEQLLLDKGINLQIGKKISALESNVVHFDDGLSLKYDMAIIATNLTPETKLPILADIKLGKSGAIAVNRYMQTNDEDIYACGKCAEVTNKITKETELTSNPSITIKQAKVIAEHLNGGNIKMPFIINNNIIKIFDYYIAICGCGEEKLNCFNIKNQKVFLRQSDKALYYPSPESLLLKLIFADNGDVLGMQIIGKSGVPERINAVCAQIQHNAKVKDLMNQEMAYAPSLTTPKDAINSIASLAQEMLNNKLRYMSLADIDDDTYLVDVRTPYAFTNCHMPNAINLPLNAIRDNLASLPQNRQIAICCNREYGAYLAYHILNQHGFDNSYLLYKD